MDILENLQGLVKSKIQITTSDGDYEGVVRLVCPVSKKLILEKLIFLPKCLFMGVLQFHVQEILSYKLISKSESNSSVKFQDHENVFNTTLQDNNNLLEDSKDLLKEDTFVFTSPQWLHLKLPTKSVILDYFGKEFHEAIALIQNQDSIGVALEGPSIGRDGILSWISIAIPSCIFHFDVQNLKNKAFSKEGLLKDIFENPRIEKILHDCRKASDCLYHQFNTMLVNVFDTQVAELVVSLQVNHKGTMPQKVNTLNFCLGKYLNVSNDSLPKPKQKSYIDEIIYHRIRPVQNETRNRLITNVIYLRALKQKLHNLLLNPFRRAVHVYLQVLQSATDRELLLEPPSEDEIPFQLVMEGLQTARFRDPAPVSSLVSPEFSVLNLKENYAKLCKSNKYNSGNRYSTNYYASQTDCRLECRNIFDHGATTKSDGYSRDELLHRTTNTRQLESKIEEKLNDHPLMEKTSTCSPSMNGKKVMNTSESLDKSLEVKNKERFRISRQKFHNLNSHNLESANYNTYNKQAVAASTIESIITKENILNGAEKMPPPEDPYAKLRAAFTSTYDIDDKEKKKLKFIPAGMS